MIIINNTANYILDVDASKVLEAIRSTGAVISPARRHYIHYAIVNLKAILNWSQVIACWGTVGGTAASHQLNWKTLGSNSMSYVNTPTHSNAGIVLNGTNQYADLNLNPSGVLNQNAFSVVLSFNNLSILTSGGGTRLFGNSDGSTGTDYQQFLNISAGMAMNTSTSSPNNTSYFETATSNIIIASRTSSSSFFALRNRSLFSTMIATSVPHLSRNYFLGAYNVNGAPNSYSGFTSDFTLVYNNSLTQLQAEQIRQLIVNLKTIRTLF